ncbi:MAG TPA: hypothetical protein PLM70_02845 [Bacteroidales bacterium]|nr:hypothetical protein [Bacteroidales bacterium]
MKNKVKAIGFVILINILFSLIFIILLFFVSKFIGFESNQLTPGSSTFSHPLITSYKDGLLLYWRKFLFFFISFFIFTFLLAISFIKPLKEYFDEKEKKKSKENDSLNENKNNEDSIKKSADGGRRTADKLS